MTNKHGTLSIDSDNLFPIIKKWLYSDHDIFYRELISNGCDAITKEKMLHPDQECDYRVTVTLDKEAKEIRFADNGIGMTAEEVEKYINQVAFSGAEEFLTTKAASLVTSVLASIPPLWWPTKSRSTLCPPPKEPNPFAGSARTAWLSPWRPATVPSAALSSPCTFRRKNPNFWRNIASAKCSTATADSWLHPFTLTW